MSARTDIGVKPMTNQSSKIALLSFLRFSISSRLLAAHLKENHFSVLCYYCEGHLDAADLHGLVAHLKEQSVSLLGISLGTDNYEAAVMLTKTIKSQLSVPVIWGGAHPTIMPDECLKYADMVCRGEGEGALLELSAGGSYLSAPWPERASL